MNTPNPCSGGLWYGLAAYAIWGILPLYFSLLRAHVTPWELLSHRLLWGLLFLGVALTAKRRWHDVFATMRNPKVRRLLIISSVLIGTNWFAFLYGVSVGRIVETSFGYFLTPLVSIALGLGVFRERLRPLAKAGLVLSVVGIVYLITAFGTMPWIALTVAVSFGLYGMVRKIAQVDGLVGLFIETLILAPAAAAYVVLQALNGGGAIVLGSGWPIALLVFSGALTAIPMVFYGEATRRLKLSTLGFLQYLLPTLQLVQAVAFLGESFRPEQRTSFPLVWVALFLVILDSLLHHKRRHQEPLKPKHFCEPRLDVREIRSEWKRRLPNWMQPFLTWLIGYPFAGQKPLFKSKPWWLVVVNSAVILILGVTLSLFIIHVGRWLWLALPIAWLLAVNGARTLQVHICHQGVHGSLSGARSVDRIVVEVISTLVFVQSHDEYKQDHVGVHHPRLASHDDPDHRFIADIMKIAPDANDRVNKEQFFWSLLSMNVHGRFLAARLKSNFITCPAYRRCMSIAWLGLLVAVLLTTQAWVQFVFGWLIPMTVLYQISAMCQFGTEHPWAKQRQLGESALEHYKSLLINRHLGEPLPPAEQKSLQLWAAWAIWWFRTLLYHVPVRLGIIVADLPVHGSHHLWPQGQGWTHAIFTYHELTEKSGKAPVEVVGSYGQILSWTIATMSCGAKGRSGCR